MKKISIIGLVMIATFLSHARLIVNPSYQEMLEQADLVVIAMPLSSTDTERLGKLSGEPPWDVIGVSTTLMVRSVLKGDKNIKKIILHHYRQLDPKAILDDGPNFVSFNIKSNYCYLLYLKKEPDGRYAPVSGQADPALFSILELKGSAR